MDSEEKNVRRGELKDEALEEISGGSGPFLCRCPRARCAPTANGWASIPPSSKSERESERKG